MNHSVTGVTLSVIVMLFAGAATAQGAAETPALPGTPAPMPSATQAAPSAETPSAAPAEAAEKKEKDLPWSAMFAVENSVSPDMMGLGQDYQTYNPSYELGLNLVPSYRLYKDDVQSVSVTAVLGGAVELTNSDITTERREWTLTDWQIGAKYSRTLLTVDDYKTRLSVKAPTLTFPTSRFSINSGMLLGTSGGAGVVQTVPLLDGDLLQSLDATVSVNYLHKFTEATTRVNSNFERARTTATLVPTVSDQLSGVTLGADVLTLAVGGEVSILENLTLSSSVEWRPYWKYAPTQSEVTVMGGSTVPVGHAENTTQYGVNTVFQAELAYKPLDEFAVAVGYLNFTNQLGEDGKRRNILYSPDARALVTLTGFLDAIYKRVDGLVSAEASLEQAAAPSRSVE